MNHGTIVWRRPKLLYEYRTETNKRLVGDSVISAQHFNMYSDAVCYLTEATLGLVRPAYSHPWDPWNIALGNTLQWEPYILIERNYVPGEGLVTKFNYLDGRHDKPN